MKIAIMQPYFLPYIGYFQLVSAADKFIILDDVNFINRGWINRNRLLLNNKEHMFTLPLSAASQNKKICDIGLATTASSNRKLIATIESAYRKAPQFDRVMPFLIDLILHDARRLGDFLFNSLAMTCEFLKIGTRLERASESYSQSQLSGAERILDICCSESAGEYLNPEGGKHLYDRARFRERGVELKFIETNHTRYQQYSAEFVADLSIIDVMMFNAEERVAEMLKDFRTV